MKQISISEIQRNLHKLDSFDIVEVIDKKRDKVKGYFLDSKYLYFINELIEKNERSRVSSDKLAGSLHQYADSKQMEKEDCAWKRHVEEKYSL
jgi:DNA-binding transcriptional regulator GbsR (MarR family)